MATGNKIYNNTNRGLYFSAFLLLIIISVSSYFYYENNYELKEQLSEINNSLTDKKNQLEKFKKDKQLQVFHLLTSNFKFFKQKEKFSNIPVIIKKIKQLEKEYEIAFDGFDYNKGKISLKAISFDSDSGEKAYGKIAKFIGDFRKEKTIETEEKQEFKLNFVNVFSGKDEKNIEFSAVLEIDPKNFKINSSKEINNQAKKIEKKFEKNTKEKLKEQLQKIREKSNKNNQETQTGTNM